MIAQNSGKTTGFGGVTGMGFQPGQSGNPGGRPKGLAKLAREAVADGRDLIDFYLAIFRGDAKAIHARKISLHDRMQAAEWLAERGWGRAPLVADADPPEEPPVNFYEALGAWARSLPPELRKVVGEVMDRQFIEGIEADIAAVDEQIKATIIQRRLGHSRIGVTMDLYAHKTPGQDAPAAEALERLIGSERG